MTKNKSADEIGERNMKWKSEIPITAWTKSMVVKRYHPYAQLPRNFRVSHRRIVFISRNSKK